MINTITQRMQRWLQRYSLPLLRISMGAVIFGFGVLKYFPGVSPAQDLVLATTHVLTFGLVPGNVAMVLLATGECGIGLSLVTGRGLRVSVYLTALWVMGILLTAILVIASTVRRKQAGQKRTGQTERDTRAASCAAAHGTLQSSGLTASLELRSCR